MKKNLTFAKLVMFVVMAVLPLSMMAQEGKKASKPVEKYWYIQADGGLSIYHGDLANYNGGIWDDFDHFMMLPKNFTKNWNAHLGVGYQFGKVVGMNLKCGYGLLSGHKHDINNKHPEYGLQALGLITDPAGTPARYNLGFEGTSYIEGNLNLTFNLFNMFKYNPRRVINLVPHIGIGGIYYTAGEVYTVDASENLTTPALANAATKGEFALAVPAGMEFTFNVAPKFDIFIDYTYNFTNTDKLDQVWKKETGNIASFTEEDLSINQMDMYSQLNLGLRYKFNNPCDIEKMARDSKKIKYRVNPDPLVQGEDGNVCFDVIVTIPEEYFEKQAVMNLQPYLAYNGGQINIDPITFVGEKVKGEGDFRVNYKEGGEFTKHYCMPYQPEMENCELMADPMFYVYNGTIYPTQDEIVKNTYFTQGATEKLADGVIAKPEPPVYDTIWENQPKDVEVLKLTYFFNKDKYNINDRRKLNKEADAAFKELLNAGETNFIIKGWASPEGEEGHNNELSNNRSNAAEKQMKKLAKKAEANFSSKGYGPDWNKFVELVRNSDLKDKDAIVNNINNSNNKERTIREMCDIYPELEKDILPQIRRAEIYTVETVQERVMKLVKK
jgi:outer membrane protein OmpA-like peptidoglycan-associated protein